MMPVGLRVVDAVTETWETGTIEAGLCAFVVWDGPEVD